MNNELKKRIESLINSSKVFLFMKGTQEQPRCGFSARVVAVLKHLKIDFKSFDVYSDEEIRQGIKEYANWPTIPQLYIDEKFIGGCDIVEELFSTGELKKTILS